MKRRIADDTQMSFVILWSCYWLLLSQILKQTITVDFEICTPISIFLSDLKFKIKWCIVLYRNGFVYYAPMNAVKIIRNNTFTIYNKLKLYLYHNFFIRKQAITSRAKSIYYYYELYFNWTVPVHSLRLRLKWNEGGK